MDAMTTNGIDVIVVAVVVLAVIVGILIAARSSSLYDQLGSGGLDLEPPPPEVSGGAARDEDIRQMLEAKNARRAARGEAPLDVDEELRRLTAAPVALDPGLEEEVRQLVEARNARLVGRGKAPLDVEAETARRLRELG